MPPKHIAFAILLLAFTAHSGDSTITYGGQTYKTVKIGEQVWLAENLNYEAEGSVCYYDDFDYCAKYGRLYNWETAKKVCPKGWHLPNHAEWVKLIRFVDGDTSSVSDSVSDYKSLTAGKHLKATSGWNSYKGSDSNGTDTYGFSALPGGFSTTWNGSFDDVGYYGEWWSASEYKSRLGLDNLAYGWRMGYFNGSANYYGSGGSSMSLLFSVRCVQGGDEKFSSSSVPSSSSLVSSSSSPVDYTGSYGSVYYEGQTYKTVTIGDQTWMAENLNYNASGSKCYGNNPANCAKYGRLYNWEMAKKICPEGWHLPTNEEWDKLYRFVDGDKGTESPYESETAGKHLKAKGWNLDDFIYSKNKYGFSALPGGSYWYLLGRFVNVGSYGNWWSANEIDSEDAHRRYMHHFNAGARWYKFNKSDLISVRCVKD